MSPKVQTTRERVLGVYTQDNVQIVRAVVDDWLPALIMHQALLDTPGILSHTEGRK